VPGRIPYGTGRVTLPNKKGLDSHKPDCVQTECDPDRMAEPLIASCKETPVEQCNRKSNCSDANIVRKLSSIKDLQCSHDERNGQIAGVMTKTGSLRNPVDENIDRVDDRLA
jgi:hypothetical protein